MTIDLSDQDFSERPESVRTDGPAGAGTAFAPAYAFGQPANEPDLGPEVETEGLDGQFLGGGEADGVARENGMPSAGALGDGPANGGASLERDGNGDASTMNLSSDLSGKLDGFTRPASDIINKARRIARELNHTSVSAAHLVLALTLDPRASRRLRDQDIDVDLVRQASVQFLAKYNYVYSSGAEPAGEPDPAPDLADILETATRFTQEREGEEEINISDLLDAFRKSGSRAKLIYDPQEPGEQMPAVLRRVDQWLAPQIDQLFADMERRLLEHAEERINALVGVAGQQLDGQISSLRQVSYQLGELANAISQGNAKRQAESSRWPFGGGR